MSYYAYATKDQMRVWKSATKPDKDYPERHSDRVQFTVKADPNGGYIAHLMAMDGYQIIKRNIQSEAGAEDY